MFKNERAYEPAVQALEPVLYDLPGKIIAIGGWPGVGKTTLGRYIAYRFNISLIETDLFLVRDKGVMVHHDDWIGYVIASRLDKPNPDWRRPVIIEGATVLRILANLGRKADFIIHVDSSEAPEITDELAADLERYNEEYAPASKANLLMTFAE